MDKTPMNVNRKWHQNIMNLLIGKNICGVCLRLEDDLVEWDDRFVFERDDLNVESSLKHIMVSAFNSSILDIIPTTKLCQTCIDIILKAFLLTHKIQENYRHIQKRITDISQQMKWTQYLDETGSLSEIKDNFQNLLDNKHAVAKKEGVTQTENNISIDQAKQTHKIFLNDESLKAKLLQVPGMHRFLSKQEENKEIKLPVDTTVKKVMRSLDLKDIEPHELLQLNWAEDTDYESVIPNTPVSKNQLHSNEALIMDLMEKAKTDIIISAERRPLLDIGLPQGSPFRPVLCHTLPPDSRNSYEVDINQKTDINHKNILQNADIVRTKKNYGKNSLSVKLVYEPNIIYDSSDNMDIVPQDLLELKWPEEDTCNAKRCIQIPVKKVNFNEALTVKFIPGQNITRSQVIDSEITPHELLELRWNEDPEKIDVENSLETEVKHNIDLTKWLQDQGMSTIKTNVLENNRHRKEILKNLNQKEKNIKTNCEKLNKTNDNQYTKMDKNDPSNLRGNIDCNDEETKPMFIINKERKCVFRCALCCLTFDQFESYSNHYKNHDITENAKCYKCPSEFSMIESLSEHLLLTHVENVANCIVCFVILNQEELAHHMSIYHEANATIINTSEEQAATDTQYCKNCKQPFDTPSDPHTCIDKDARCNECKKACVHEKYLSSYRKQLKSNKRTFKCADCKFKYKNKCEIIKHCNEVHLKQKSYRCKICDIGFSLKVSLGKHNNLHHVRCKRCRRVFEDRVSVSKHKCKSSGATLKCELCGQKFNESKHKQHKECALHVTEECIFCQRIVPVKCNMVRHMEYVHNVCLKQCSESIVYECLVCECKFNNDKEFSTHNWIHTGVHECHVCAKRFTSKILYETHFKMHSADQCDLAKLFLCSVCGEQMIDKYAWDHHMQGHSDHEKCLICSKYIEKASLSNHIEGHEVLETTFKCPHCPLIVNSHYQYEIHVNRFHLKHRPYQCDTCKKRFYGKRLLRQHINVHNKLQCNLSAQRKFSKKRSFERHMTPQFKS